VHGAIRSGRRAAKEVMEIVGVDTRRIG